MSIDTNNNINTIMSDEVIQHVFSFVDDGTLGKVKQVCKDWLVLATDEVFLKALYREPAEAFGEEMWKTHIGEIEQPPRLPLNIKKTLASPCPIWDGKKIKETHILVYRPERINGKPNTVNNIGKLVPMDGKPTGYRFICDVEEHGDTPATEGKWLLMTKDVLPGSLGKRYADQQELVKQLSQQTGVEYEVPHLLDTITCIFAEYKRSGKYLYGNNTYTRCQERATQGWPQGWPLLAGGFACEGLFVYGSCFNDDDYGVGALRKV